MIRAKFFVTRIGKATYAPKGELQTEIELLPVTGGSEENKKFYAYTPGGSIKLSVLKEETAKEFEIGKEYYVDFTKAE